MNTLLIIVGLIFLVCIAIGVKRGFIKLVASLAITIATIVLVMFLSPYVSEAILKHTPIEKLVKEHCISLFMDEESAQLLEEHPEFLTEIDLTREQQISLIEGADVPEIFRKILLDNNNSEIYEALGVTTFVEYTYKYLAKLIADIIAFLLTFLVITIVARIATYVLGIIGKLPIIGGINRFAGGVLGVATGLILTWTLFIVITLLYKTDFAITCFQNIEDSIILKLLYDNNVLMNYITGL